jgi:methylmalonyl-CoA/ethylmalonyl-CoA epimerase
VTDTAAGRPPSVPFGRLHHIGIVVKELEPTRSTIRELLQGCVVDEGEDQPLGARWLWIESPGNPIIELVTASGDGPIADYLARHGEGLHHVSFQTGSLDESLAHVHRCGFGVVGENRDHSGYEEFFVAPAVTGRALFHSFRPLDTAEHGSD